MSGVERVRTVGVGAVVLALVVAGVGPGVTPASAANTVESGVLSVSVTGPGAATTRGGVHYVWQDEAATVRVEVADYLADSETYYADYSVRVTRDRHRTFRPAFDASLADGRVTLGELAVKNVSLTVDATELSPGYHTLYASMYNTSDVVHQRRDDREFRVYVLSKHGDLDDDGYDNVAEIRGETDFRDADTDDDGVLDGYEVHQFGTDPTLKDTDGDGVRDAEEIRAGADPTRADTDGDSLADPTEVGNASLPVAASDADVDGLPDAVEVELGTNPRKRDTDGDGLTDWTEYRVTGSNPRVADTDGDGLSDGVEYRRYGTDPTRADTDDDGIPDGREVLLGLDPATEDSNSDENANALTGALRWATAGARAPTGGAP